MTKNVFGDDRVETTLVAEKSSFKRNTTDLWPEFFFKQQPSDYGTEKEDYPENTVFYINQAFQSYKYNKVYYAGYLIIGQINQCLNTPENIE